MIEKHLEVFLVQLSDRLVDLLQPRRLRRHHIQSVCRACSLQNVRWPIVQRDGTAVEHGKTVAKRWPAGGCRPDHWLSPASATLTPSSVGSGRPQP